MILADCAISQLPRIIGFVDRDPASRTYGCCDRHYWHYKVTDFPNARLQEAAHALILASRLNAAENRFFGSQKLIEWARACMAFWARRRHSDGSTDESYPFERHFCSTAFTVYSVTESLLELGILPDFDLSSSGNFLLRHQNPEVANQEACAATALYNLYLLTKDDQYLKGFEKRLAELLKSQSPQGNFSEYGGFDLGYDSITLSFLGDLYLKTRRDEIKRSGELCARAIGTRLDSQAGYSNKGMSRQTQFLYPFGFRVFLPEVIQRMEQGIAAGRVLIPGWMDDRYCIPLSVNYLKAVREVGA